MSRQTWDEYNSRPQIKKYKSHDTIYFPKQEVDFNVPKDHAEEYLPMYIAIMEERDMNTLWQ